MSLKFFVCIIFLVFSTAHAAEIPEVHTNARALGMGGAYAAIVSDEESLFYNPAGIAKNGGFFWTIADPRAGISDPDAMTSFSDLADAATFSSTLDSLYGEPIWGGGGAKTSVMLPFFALAYFYDVDVGLLVDNPVSPTISANVVTDEGWALGTGWSMGGILQMGLAFRYIDRVGARKTFGAATIADISAGTSTPDVIFDQFDNSGTGYGVDLGINLTIPTVVQPTFSFVWKNIGNTKFRKDSASLAAPPTEPSDMTVGAAIEVDLPLLNIAPVVEIRHLDDADIELGQKIHMGVELGLPLLDLRAGLYQGYYTLGVGLDLGLLRIEAATWGVEMGGYPGQLESRRYMIQLTSRIGLDLGLGGGGAGSSKSKAGAGSGSSSGGRKKLKLRR